MMWDLEMEAQIAMDLAQLADLDFIYSSGHPMQPSPQIPGPLPQNGEHTPR